MQRLAVVRHADKLRLIKQYKELSTRLGRRPTRYEICSEGLVSLNKYYLAFDSWLCFLDEVSDLTTEERDWLDTPAEQFLRELERTLMAKAYKVPAIKTFLKDDTIVTSVTLREVGQSFWDFYSVPEHQVDLTDKRQKEWRSWLLEDYMQLAKENPVRYLSQHSGAFFLYDEASQLFSLMPYLNLYLSPHLAGHVADILDYRAANYFYRLRRRGVHK